VQSDLSKLREVLSTKEFLVGVDIGSSGIKVTLLSPDQGIVASESFQTQLHSDAPGWAEADPGQWWQGFCNLIPRIIRISNIKSEQILAIAISGMVPAVLITDKDGEPLRRALLQNDARAFSEIEFLRDKLSNLDLLKLTGSVLSQQSVAPTGLWLAKNEPDVWKKTKYIIGSYDWISLKLGAQAHVEQNWAIESGLYGWDENPIQEVIAATNITWPNLLPIKKPGEVVGVVSERASKDSSLSVGTKIVVGGADHVLSAYGAGLVNSGECLVKLGGAGDILVVSDKFVLDSRLYLDAHPIPNKWLPNGCMATSGSVLRWEQNLFGGVDLKTLDNEAKLSRPGSLIVLPYFLGEKTPLHDPDLRGVIAGLHLGTTRGNIHRSLLEAIAYGFKHHLEIFGQAGIEIKSPKVTNGGSKSKLWRQILSDVLNQNLTSIINHPGASLGAAVIAGLGIGLIKNWRCVDEYLEQGEIFEPNMNNVGLYTDRYQQYLSLAKETTGVSHLLARSNR
jgi:xylulokinase